MSCEMYIVLRGRGRMKQGGARKGVAKERRRAVSFQIQ